MNNENLEVVMKAIGEITKRLDTVESQPRIMVINAEEPLVPGLRRELAKHTLTDAPIEEREAAVSISDELAKYKRGGDHTIKDEIAKSQQGEWQGHSDREMFAKCGAKLRIEDILSQVGKEVAYAQGKFPGDNVTFAALVEEVGELATALFSQDRDAVRKEAVQVACMAVRVITDGDCTFDVWRDKYKLDPLIDRDPSLPNLHTCLITPEEAAVLQQYRSERKNPNRFKG